MFGPLFGPLGAPPPPSESFLALGDDNSAIPPDTNGAAGPSQLLVMLNTQVRVETKTGTPLSTVSLDSFWSPVEPSGNITFDPHVYYDPFGGRWIASVDSTASAGNSNGYLLIAASQSTDATAGWNFYSVQIDSTNATWGDFPILGFNSKWLAVSTNIFTSGGAFVKSSIYAFNKANLYAGASGTYTLLSDPQGQNGGFAMAPAITYDNSTGTLFLLDDWNGSSSGSGYLRLSTITGAVGSETLTTGVAFPSTANPWNDNDPGDIALQRGSSQGIDTGDSRLYEVFYRSGSLWTAHTISLPATNPTRSAVQWWAVDTAGNVQQVGREDDSTGTVMRAYPSLAVNSAGDVLMAYSEFSASIYASAYYTYRTPADAANTFEPEVLDWAGLAPYYKTNGGSENRWGDFSITTVDPADDLTMWTIQEYAASPQNTFGTWWIAVPPVTTGVPSDFDGNGTPDLLLYDASTGQGAVWFMNQATPTGGAFVSPTQNTSWLAVGDADFTHTGHPDILFQSQSTGQLAIWLMTGETATNGVVLSPTPAAGWAAVGVADFDGDGYPDILLQNSSTGKLAVWFLTGTTVVNGAFIASTPPAGWSVVGTGDLNHDGHPDIVLQNSSTGQLAVWSMNGITVTGAAYITPTQSAAWRCASVIAFDLPSYPDLLIFQNRSTGKAAYWVMNGANATGGGYISNTPPAGWNIVGPR